MEVDQSENDPKVIQQLFEKHVKRYLKCGLIKAAQPLIKASHSSSAEEIQALGRKHYDVCTKRCMNRINEILEKHQILAKKREIDALADRQNHNKDQAVRRLTGNVKHDLQIAAGVVHVHELRKEVELLKSLKYKQEELVDRITNVSNNSTQNSPQHLVQ